MQSFCLYICPPSCMGCGITKLFTGVPRAVRGTPGFPSLPRQFTFADAEKIRELARRGRDHSLPVGVTWGVDRPIMKKTLCFGLFFCVTTAFFSATAATGCEDHIHPYIDCSRARTTELWQGFRASTLNATPSATSDRTLGNSRALLSESPSA